MVFIGNLRAQPIDMVIVAIDSHQPRAVEEVLDAARAVVRRRNRRQRQPVGATVEIGLADDLVAGGDDLLDRGRRRRGCGGEAVRE